MWSGPAGELTIVRAPLLKSRLSGIWRHSANALLSNQIHRLKLELPAELPSFHTCLRLRAPYLGILQTGYSSRTIDNVATSLAWIASHARTIATVDIQEPPLSTRPNMSPTREIPILAAPPQVSCRLRTLPPRQWQRSS